MAERGALAFGSVSVSLLRNCVSPRSLCACFACVWRERAAGGLDRVVSVFMVQWGVAGDCERRGGIGSE